MLAARAALTNVFTSFFMVLIPSFVLNLRKIAHFYNTNFMIIQAHGKRKRKPENFLEKAEKQRPQPLLFAIKLSFQLAYPSLTLRMLAVPSSAWYTSTTA